MASPLRRSALPDIGPTEDAPAAPRADAQGDVRPPLARGERPQAKSSAPKQQRKSVATLKSVLRRHPYVAAAAVALGIAIVAAAIAWWLYARNFESTDDAFIDARVVSISAQVSGAITQVAVTDNQLVAAGTVLLRLDDRDYQAALAQAKAQVEPAQATIANLGAQIEEQQARIEQAQNQVAEAQAALTFAQAENERAQDLATRGAGTTQRAQQTSSDLRQRQAALEAAEANRSAAAKQIAVLKTQQEAAAGQLDAARAGQAQAEANLSRTVITAPVAGRATKISAAKGAYAQPGQALMMFVPTNVWVTANFKETQLTHMRPGQPVSITVDAYPGRSFAGHVDSIQAGSRAAFSLLPPENATGNYVKVVQRVPVKISFNEPPEVHLGPGMSVIPRVRVR
jgi:membrane fusion protein (multidrug efflux system)